MLNRLVCAVAVIFLSALTTNAGVPQLINYQGVLVDGDGARISGTYSVQFGIYNSETGGEPLWSETQSVVLTDGLFHVLLGAVTLIPHSVLDGGDKYLSVKIGADPEITPRRQVVSVAYAFHSNGADSLDGYAASDFLRSMDGVTPDDGNVELLGGSNIDIASNDVTNTITISATDVGLMLPYSGSTESGSTAFSVTATGTGRAGDFRVDNSGNSNQVIYAETNGLGRAGHFRIVNASNDTEAVAASTQGDGAALSGYTTGGGPAVYGRSDGNSNAAYFEITDSNNSSSAVHASTDGSGNGVHGESTGGDGVYGFTSANTKSGVRGVSDNPQAYGVFASNDDGKGVYGRSYTGTAVYAIGNYGTGVYGQSSGEGKAGVQGWNGSAGGYGVLGGSLSGVAVYAQGDMDCTGTKSARVRLDNGNAVRLYAEESAESWFSDYGEARLTEGQAHIELDPVFLQTVTIDARHPMKVFVQLEGDCNGVYVTNKTSMGFDVVELRQGSSNVPFSYRVVCKRKYYEDDRLVTPEEGAQTTSLMMQAVWPETIALREAERAESEPE
jgi:hypothetical protein